MVFREAVEFEVGLFIRKEYIKDLGTGFVIKRSYPYP